MIAIQPETMVLEENGRVPNSVLPVLLYRAAESSGAAAVEALFARNDWGKSWRNGIYPFHHFHSTAHEALGIAAGRVEVRLGGEDGRDVTLNAGDIVVLPAGTGHKRLAGSADLVVVGAYPDGRAWDLIRADDLDQAGYDAARARIAAVPVPCADPVAGSEGHLLRLWRR